MTGPGVLRKLDTVPAATAAAVGVGVALVIVFAANYHVPRGQNGGTGPGIVTGLACLALAGLLFAVLLPRLPHPERSLVLLGILAVASLAVFWSGITPVLAAATLAAPAGRGSPSRARYVAQLLAVAAAVVALAATLATAHLG